MSPLVRGLLAGVFQLLLLLGVAGKYALDRATLPRQWIRVELVDPDALVRGRYLILRGAQSQSPRQFEFFVPEHSALNRRLNPGEELWAEVSTLPQGLRAIRVEIRGTGNPR